MKFIPILILATALCGCSAGRFNLYRMFPDGASVTIKKPQVTVSMTGAGSMSADEITWTGTNGFPIPGTNSAPVKP